MTKTKKPQRNPASAKKPPIKRKIAEKKPMMNRNQINGQKGGKVKGLTVAKVKDQMTDPKKLNLSPFKNIIDDEEKRGRPSKMTEATIWKLHEALKLGVPVIKACKWAKIDKATYYRWKDSNADFCDTMTDAENFASKLCRLSVLKQVQAGDGKLGLKWLALKENAEFNNKTVIESTDDEEENTTGIWSAEEIEQIKQVLGDDYEILDDKDDD